MAKYDHIDFKPPQDVADAAALGLRYRDEHGRGGTEVGVARARDLSNRRNVSPSTITRMVSYFARHEVDKQGTGWADAQDPSAGYIAWLLWGGDAGQRWAGKVKGQMDAADKRENRSSARAVICADVKLGDYPVLQGDILKGVRLFAWGEVAHPMGDFEVTRAFAESIVKHWSALADESYFAPLLIEHTSDGRAHGFVYDLRIDDKGVMADFKLSPAMVAAYEAGELAYVSPSFWPEWTHPHSGETWANVLREVSFVSVPHLKNIGALHPAYSMSEGLVYLKEIPMDPQETPVEEPKQEEMAEPTLTEVLAAVMAVAERLSALEGMMMPPGEDSEVIEDGDGAGGEQEMSERVKALERQVKLAEAKAEVAQAMPSLKADELVEMAELKISAPKLYEIAKKRTQGGVQQPIGNSAQAPAPAKPKSLMEAADALAAKDKTLTYAQALDRAKALNPDLK